MVASQVTARGRAPFAKRRAAELAHPHDQRRIEQSLPPQVADQGRHGTVHRRAASRPGSRAGLLSGSCRGSPIPSRTTARTAPPVRPAGGRAGNCWQTTLRRAVRRILRAPLLARPKCPSAPAPPFACGRPARIERCGWPFPDRPAARLPGGSNRPRRRAPAAAAAGSSPRDRTGTAPDRRRCGIARPDTPTAESRSPSRPCPRWGASRRKRTR